MKEVIKWVKSKANTIMNIYAIITLCNGAYSFIMEGKRISGCCFIISGILLLCFVSLENNETSDEFDNFLL